MGSFLSEPVTEKESTDETNDRLSYGTSSMQGWRLSQEDAHNCILEYDKNTSLFAVYDGHGGHEVAQYCSEQLPDFIKKTAAYNEGRIEQALIDAFLGFDATINTADVIAYLKKIAGDQEDEEGHEDSDTDEENVNHLYEEAAMPIEQVIEKYTSNLVNPALRNLEGDAKWTKSPCLKAKRASDETVVGTSSSTAGCSTDDAIVSCSAGDGVSSSSERDASEAKCSSAPDSSTVGTSNQPSSSSINSTINGPASSSSSSSLSKIPEIKVSLPDSSDATEAAGVVVASSIDSGVTAAATGSGKKAVCSPKDSKNSNHTHVTTQQNGDVSKSSIAIATVADDPVGNSANNDVTSSSVVVPPPTENGDVVTLSKKGKNKAGKIELLKSPRIKRTLRRSAQQLYQKWLDFGGEDSDDTDEEDKTFEAPKDADNSDDEHDGVNIAIGVDNSDEDSSAAEEEQEDDGQEIEDCEDEEDDDDDDIDGKGDRADFLRSMKEEPGSNSGCTAVVALLKSNELYVANAGDSRCIICRNGKAVDMSFDHKPEDEPERDRVVKAGGRITSDGRVNGGLNLSRAIGDFAYKQNDQLTASEQMITALPDVKTLTINPADDEFMVLACDGIWNFMSSQEVVDFIRPQIQDKEKKLSEICEDICEHCLAPNTMGDGTGCDNMTVIIVKFKTNILKRAADASCEADDSKVAKTDADNKSESHIIDTTV